MGCGTSKSTAVQTSAPNNDGIPGKTGPDPSRGSSAAIATKPVLTVRSSGSPEIDRQGNVSGLDSLPGTCKGVPQPSDGSDGNGALKSSPCQPTTEASTPKTNFNLSAKREVSQERISSKGVSATDTKRHGSSNDPLTTKIDSKMHGLNSEDFKARFGRLSVPECTELPESFMSKNESTDNRKQEFAVGLEHEDGENGAVDKVKVAITEENGQLSTTYIHRGNDSDNIGAESPTRKRSSSNILYALADDTQEGLTCDDTLRGQEISGITHVLHYQDVGKTSYVSCGAESRNEIASSEDVQDESRRDGLGSESIVDPSFVEEEKYDENIKEEDYENTNQEWACRIWDEAGEPCTGTCSLEAFNTDVIAENSTKKEKGDGIYSDIERNGAIIVINDLHEQDVMECAVGMESVRKETLGSLMEERVISSDICLESVQDVTFSAGAHIKNNTSSDNLVTGRHIRTKTISKEEFSAKEREQDVVKGAGGSESDSKATLGNQQEKHDVSNDICIKSSQDLTSWIGTPILGSDNPVNEHHIGTETKSKDELLISCEEHGSSKGEEPCIAEVTKESLFHPFLLKLTVGDKHIHDDHETATNKCASIPEVLVLESKEESSGKEYRPSKGEEPCTAEVAEESVSHSFSLELTINGKHIDDHETTTDSSASTSQATDRQYSTKEKSTISMDPLPKDVSTLTVNLLTPSGFTFSTYDAESACKDGSIPCMSSSLEVSKSSRIERHVNQTLDVHPSIRSVRSTTPREAISAQFDRVQEEEEEEEESEEEDVIATFEVTSHAETNINNDLFGQTSITTRKETVHNEPRRPEYFEDSPIAIALDVIESDVKVAYLASHMEEGGTQEKTENGDNNVKTRDDSISNDKLTSNSNNKKGNVRGENIYIMNSNDEVRKDAEAPNANEQIFGTDVREATYHKDESSDKTSRVDVENVSQPNTIGNTPNEEGNLKEIIHHMEEGSDKDRTRTSTKSDQVVTASNTAHTQGDVKVLDGNLSEEGNPENGHPKDISTKETIPIITLNDDMEKVEIIKSNTTSVNQGLFNSEESVTKEASSNSNVKDKVNRVAGSTVDDSRASSYVPGNNVGDLRRSGHRNKTVESVKEKLIENNHEETKTKALEAKRKLSTALRLACKALPWQHISDLATPAVLSLSLFRAFPWKELSVAGVLRRLTSLNELDLSNNQIGPQGFRVVCLAMSKNSTLSSLNVANNLADTDSSKSIGIMLTRNRTLKYLDVSGNDLGKDYFSRCVGPALRVNRSLKTLKCSSCGASEMLAICEALGAADGNRTLEGLDTSNNQLGEEFGKGIGIALKRKNCSLKTLDIHATNLGVEGMAAVLKGIEENESIVLLNIGGHEMHRCSSIIELLYCCITHPKIQNLCLDNTKSIEVDGEWGPKTTTTKPSGTTSPMTRLSIAGCSLSDSLVKSLANETKTMLPRLNVLDVSNNPSLTAECLHSFCQMTCESDANIACPIQALDFALNNAEDIPDFLAKEQRLQRLKHLSLRKSKITSAKLVEFHQFIAGAPSEEHVAITSLNLDGIKLSGTNTLQGILGIADNFLPKMPCALTSLSLGGCSLNDKDTKPLLIGAAKRLGLRSLKLSSNRLTETSVVNFVDALEGTCLIEFMDLSNNKIRTGGAETLATAVKNGKFPNLSSLLISNNSIGASGLLALVALVTPHSTLHNLNLKDQQVPVGEEDMDEIFATLAESLEIPLTKTLTPVSSYLNLHSTISINLTGLGGEPGANGALLDSLAIQTDYSRKHKRSLKLEDAFSMSAVLTNSTEEEPSLTQEEWDLVIGADKDAPAWLQVSSYRSCGVYISNLPLTVTRERLESLLEDDADCNVKEVFLMKDPILRKPNGLAWTLFTDENSVTKALEYYDSGEAQVYGRPFVISRITVNVTTVKEDISTEERASSQKETYRSVQWSNGPFLTASLQGNQAFGDIEAGVENLRQYDNHNLSIFIERRIEIKDREALHKADESTKAGMIQANFEESSARHEYAAQHPAYADGRIW